MPESTTPQLTESEVEKIEARHARCMDNKNQSRLAEASILIASDIPALIRDWRALRAALREWEDNHDRLCLQREQLYRDVHAENATLRVRLAQVEKERNSLRGQVVGLNTKLDKVEQKQK